jgi:hypothetical protein
MKMLFLFYFLSIMLLSDCKTYHPAEISDGFESHKLSNIWRSDKFLPGDLEIQSEIVRSGKSAVKITLHPGDQIDDEKGTILERAEIMEKRTYFAQEDLDYTYEFSLFLPAGFPIVPTRLVIAQWKQECERDSCKPDNPIIALRYSSGELNITLQTGPEKIALYNTTDDIRSEWLDFRFKIHFSRQQQGFITAFLNGNKIIDYSGITAYSETYGYPYPGHFYFKTGLYRDNMDRQMTIYIDDFKQKNQTSGSVAGYNVK